MKNIAIFASGSGTNAENLIKFFLERDEAKINLLMANRPDAYALVRAEKLGVPVRIFTREDFYQTNKVLDDLRGSSTDLIVLAGFLWLVPNDILDAYPNRIINIHPALLPKYGGKGMYGSRVHEAVISNGESESGISIHLVNQEYDKGEMLFQSACNVLPADTPDSLAEKIHAMEYKHFPEVVLEYLKRI